MHADNDYIYIYIKLMMLYTKLMIFIYTINDFI